MGEGACEALPAATGSGLPLSSASVVHPAVAPGSTPGRQAGEEADADALAGAAGGPVADACSAPGAVPTARCGPEPRADGGPREVVGPRAVRAGTVTARQTPERPPKALPPRKASCAQECERLQQLPNIGPAMAGDLERLGVSHPRELAQADPLQLYLELGRRAGRRQDPCVLDAFMAAVDFMRGAAPRPWWSYTAERKARYGVV